jgi:triosephosphate isomerase
MEVMSARPDLGSPLFLLNMKAYPSGLGTGALYIGRRLGRLGKKYGVSVALAPTPSLMGWLARELTIPVVSQHADPFQPGARTGYILPSALKAVGIRGSILNHSEHRLLGDPLKEAARLLAEEGLATIVCAGDAKESVSLADLCHPDYLAVEPPELIGGKISVSQAKPEVVSDTVAAVRKVSPRTKVLCGAGIHNGGDVRKAIELGAEGVLVASAVAAARNPEDVMKELLSGFKPISCPATG